MAYWVPSFVADSNLLTGFLLVFYTLAVPCVARAIMRSRTPQGATAWVVGLLSFPFLTVPLYLFFGRSKFNGYRIKRRALDRKAREELATREKVYAHEVVASPELHGLVSAVKTLEQVTFTGNNKIQLLTNAERVYEEMLAEIESAQKYILFQFYIFCYDSTGERFAEALMKKAREGVKIRFLYDEIGSKVPKKIVRRMRRAGISVGQFNTTKGPKNRFQINFRNHRKIVLVDGRTAFTGGMNISDDCIGKNPKFRPWRDTHLRIEGPAVMAIQSAFAKDWYWSQGEILKDNWEAQLSQDSQAQVLAVHTGPVDEGRNCLQVHVAMVNAAKTRLWIATPYLVLPDSLFDALALAAQRGVDVRIIVPQKSDHRVVQAASQVYQEELLRVGVRMYRYSSGFLHQKVLLVDELLGCVGSANLDYRSMFLNFELSVMCTDSSFVRDLHEMFEVDLENSQESNLKEFEGRSYFHKLTSRTADLLASIL